MDDMTRLIAECAASVQFEDLSDEIVHAATQHLVDSLACGIAAYECDIAEVGLRLARGAAPQRYPGRIIGHRERSSAEAATFVNSAMIRYLDFNDTATPGGHPSDCLGAHLALAEAAGADGPRLLASIVATYELFIRFSRAINLRDMGWDQGFAVAVCTAAGIGNLLQLPTDKIGHAVSIAATSGLPMRNTRAGALSHWKGAATSFAARNGVFATLLAGEGITGPDRPFEGRDGMWQLITGPFELERFGPSGGYLLPEVRCKYFPVESNAQAGIWAALDLRGKIDWRDLTDVDISTYAFCVKEIAGEPEKWDPLTRETADHSLPYIFGRALVDGTINAASFEESAYLDPNLRPLMAKVRVRVDDAMEAVYPGTVLMRVDATTSKGQRHSIEIRNPLGHEENPMTDADTRSKFLAAAEPALGAGRARSALERWWDLPHVSNISEALDLLDS
jgi:2-methylcitrate dehydratase